MKLSENKITLIFGVANSHFIAAGCARVFAGVGAPDWHDLSQ
jgi:enoyl-[acyl-carrier-protein] reductase (NADH)